MNPCYFGSSEAPLFGAHYPPKNDAGEGRGVVLCGPGPEEYMRCHWALRQLASQLTRQGAHVFKFDYYGTGDSAGSLGAGHADLWRANVVEAANELRDIAGVKRLTLVGVRLGAALALQAATEVPADLLAGIVLWDPVVSGVAYVEELRRQQARRIENSRYPLERALDARQPELLGYPFPASAEAAVGRIDLLKGAKPAVRCTVVASTKRSEYDALAAHLGAAAPAIVEDPCGWGTQELLEVAILPQRLLQRVAEAAA